MLPTNGDNIAQDNEIGPRQNNRFGLAPEQRADPDIQREYSWDYSASVQHEILPNLSVMAGWYYARTYDAQRTLNVLRSVERLHAVPDAEPLQPTETLTIFRLDPARSASWTTSSTNSDVNRRDYQAFEAGMTSRLTRGGTINFGWAMERAAAGELRYAEPEPAALLRPDRASCIRSSGRSTEIPFRHEFKFSMAQQLPMGVQRRRLARSVSRAPTCSLARAARPTSSAEPVRSRGRFRPNLFPGGQTEVVTIPLVSPGVRVPQSVDTSSISA